MKRLFRAAVLLMAVLVLILSAQTALAETATAGTPKTPFYIILTENMKVDYNNKAYQLKTNMIVKVIDTTTVPWKCQYQSPDLGGITFSLSLTQVSVPDDQGLAAKAYDNQRDYPINKNGSWTKDADYKALRNSKLRQTVAVEPANDSSQQFGLISIIRVSEADPMKVLIRDLRPDYEELRSLLFTNKRTAAAEPVASVGASMTLEDLALSVSTLFTNEYTLPKYEEHTEQTWYPVSSETDQAIRAAYGYDLPEEVTIYTDGNGNYRYLYEGVYEPVVYPLPVQ